MKILMVCLGNICRSPLAEGILQHKAQKAGLDWVVESAGTLDGHVGECPHELSQRVSKLNGIDISRQKARKFVKADMQHYDKIYAMAEDVLHDMERISGEKLPNARASLFLDELFPGQHLDVPDPWYGPEAGYHEVYKMIEKTCEAMIENYLITNRQRENT